MIKFVVQRRVVYSKHVYAFVFTVSELKADYFETSSKTGENIGKQISVKSLCKTKSKTKQNPEILLNIYIHVYIR